MKYSYIDEFPVQFTVKAAAMFSNGQWRPIDLADAQFKAKLVTEEEFKKSFPGLPDYTFPIG
jgi:hypothetical protein